MKVQRKGTRSRFLDSHDIEEEDGNTTFARGWKRGLEKINGWSLKSFLFFLISSVPLPVKKGEGSQNPEANQLEKGFEGE